MKKASICLVMLAGMAFGAYAQHKNVDTVTTASYNDVLKKDLATVIKKLRIKDTSGRMSTGYFPQVEQGTKFIVLEADNGDLLAFKQNMLWVIVPAKNNRKKK